MTTVSKRLQWIHAAIGSDAMSRLMQHYAGREIYISNKLLKGWDAIVGSAAVQALMSAKELIPYSARIVYFPAVRPASNRAAEYESLFAEGWTPEQVAEKYSLTLQWTKIAHARWKRTGSIKRV